MECWSQNRPLKESCLMTFVNGEPWEQRCKDTHEDSGRVQTIAPWQWVIGLVYTHTDSPHASKFYYGAHNLVY